MGGRPRNFGGICVTAAALLAAGCSYTTQSAKVHPPFVPSRHGTAAAAVLPEPPGIPNSPALSPIGPVLRSMFEFSEERVNAEALVQQAYLRLQHGKVAYQAGDIRNARKEFDTAVDLMFAASSQDPGDRQISACKLDDMVDTIHRYDLAGLGAADSGDEQWRAGAARRYPQDDLPGGSPAQGEGARAGGGYGLAAAAHR